MITEFPFFKHKPVSLFLPSNLIFLVEPPPFQVSPSERYDRRFFRGGSIFGRLFFAASSSSLSFSLAIRANPGWTQLDGLFSVSLTSSSLIVKDLPVWRQERRYRWRSKKKTNKTKSRPSVSFGVHKREIENRVQFKRRSRLGRRRRRRPQPRPPSPSPSPSPSRPASPFRFR